MLIYVRATIPMQTLRKGTEVCVDPDLPAIRELLAAGYLVACDPPAGVQCEDELAELAIPEEEPDL